MAEKRVQRRLVAILAADVVGYSRLMGEDETGTLAALKVLLGGTIDPAIAEYKGRVVKLMGDGVLAEFASIVDAVECAVKLQRALAKRNANPANGKPIVFRIGVNLGDVIVDGEDIHGDGVNVAARLEGLAAPGGLCISATVFDQVKAKLDLPFEDLGPQKVKNIAEPLRAYQWQPDATGTAPESPPAQAPALPDIPSIAVMPFKNMSGDPEQDYFCDGLVEDIITTLSKLAGLRVIARNSTFAYKGQAVDIREAAEKLAVRYVLEGSVRKSGNQVRITAQLIDASDGTHLWAERYDRAMDDIFAIQDEITLVLATEMQVKLTDGEQARLHYTTTDNVEAWTNWVEGLSHFREAITEHNMRSARVCWERALALDPASASLHAMLGLIHCLDARFAWWDDRDTALGRARGLTDKALELEPANADAHITSSSIFLFQERFDEAVRDARRAIELAPGSAYVAELASFILAPSGFAEEAVIQSKKAIALNPNHPAVYLGNLGNAYHLSGQIEDAITAFKAYDARSPGFGLVDLVIIYQQNGRPDQAIEAAERLMDARPDFNIASWRKTQFRRDQVRLEADIEALRAAQLPMA
jgi:adenylate cyclase